MANSLTKENLRRKTSIPVFIRKELERQGIVKLRPSQEKSLNVGLLEGKNILVCTPTASGKTLVGELAIINLFKHLFDANLPKELSSPIAIYVVPLKALASEKYRSFSNKYPQLKITLTSGDMDSDDRYLAEYDVIITTSEKLDSLIRHSANWISRIRLLVVDEIHLLNDQSRGPTLEILLTLLRMKNPLLQVIALSATIGNPNELASWLGAELVEDSWRPVELRKGIFYNGDITFYD